MRSTALIAAVLLTLSQAASAEPPVWTVDPAESEIRFYATQLGSEFEGAFTDFTAEIRFDPGALDASETLVTIETASLDTGEDQRDTTAKGPEFFDVTRYPTATFEVIDFTHLGDDRYQATASLKMKETVKPVTLPFTLNFTADRAMMAGEISIDRTEWGIGTGEWLSGDTVGKTVRIAIDIVATR